MNGDICTFKASEGMMAMLKGSWDRMDVQLPGIEFHQPLQPGTGTTAACDLFRKYVPRLEQDRILYKDMRTAAELVHSAEIVKHVEAKIGPLQF